MRRLFIMRKDLHMSSGKLSAQVGHCAEAYWLHMIRKNVTTIIPAEGYRSEFVIDCEMFEQYVNGSIVKTICEAKSKSNLLKAKDKAIELGLEEGVDFGLIYDNCLTELTPEEENGTTLTGIWFKPLPDEIAHKISKKYHLYV